MIERKVSRACFVPKINKNGRIFKLILLPKIASVHFSLFSQLDSCCTSSNKHFDHKFACKKRQFTTRLTLPLAQTVSLFTREYQLIDKVVMVTIYIK